MNEQNPFRKALDWFGPNGERWAKGGFVLGDARCAYGGLALVLGVDVEETDRLPSPYEEIIDSTAQALFPDRWTEDWIVPARKTASVNDHPDTTFDDIRTLFEKAAVRWDERI